MTTGLSRILKRPGKAILYLFVIMLLFIVKDSYGHGNCNNACFGPVWKVKIYSEIANGFIHVSGNSVMANDSGNGTIYKISKGKSFYLYDAQAAKFICWVVRKDKKKGRIYYSLGAKKFKAKQLDQCEFKDEVSKVYNQTHVYLVSTFNQSLKMSFRKNGRSCPHHVTRHQHKRCAADVMVIAQGENNKDCGCPEARSFCQTRLRKMVELRDICNLTWPRSNETYET